MKSLLTIQSLLLTIIGFSQSFRADLTNVTKEVFSGDSVTQIIKLTNQSASSISLDISIPSASKITFTKANGADWTLEENQDVITDNVKITRQNSRGIFNAALENSFDSSSPVDTEWAFGKTKDLNKEDYSSWVEAVNYEPSTMLNRDMSLHLISEDQYYDVFWTSWTCCGNGGGFSYDRTRAVYWLEVNEATIDIPLDGSVQIIVKLSALNLTAGTYLDSLTITEAADDADSISIDVSFTVDDAAGIFSYADSIVFGTQFIDASHSQTIKIKNVGSLDLLITEILINNDAYTISPNSSGIDPGQSQLFEVTFSPTSAMDYSAEISFLSNDPTNSSISIPVTGLGVEPPIINVSPVSLQSSLNTGDNEDQSFIIKNTGNSTLYYDTELYERSSSGPLTFELLKNDPDEVETGFDVKNVYTGFTNNEIFIKMENYIPFEDGEEEIIKETVIAIDADQNTETGLDVERVFDWGLGVEYVIYFDSESFILAKYNQTTDEFDEIGLVDYQFDPELGQTTFTLERRHLTEKFNFSILISEGYVDQIPDTGAGNIEFSFNPSWLTLDKLDGSVETGGEQQINVSIDAENLFEGKYEAVLTLNNNDPITNEVLVEVSLDVIGFAKFVGPEILDFGETFVNIKDSLYLVVQNPGTATLTLDQFSSESEELSFSSNSLTIKPFESNFITVYLKAANIGDFSSNFTFTTNDAQVLSASIPVTASMVAPPIAELSTNTIISSVYKGNSTTEQISILNSGGSSLQYEISRPLRYALSLDQEYYSVDFENSYLIGDLDAITVSMWIYLAKRIDCDNGNNWRLLLSKSLSFATGSGFDIILEDNASFSWSLGTENGILRHGSDYELPVGEWTFVSFTYDGSIAKVFANGVEVSGESDNPSAGGKILSNFSQIALSAGAASCQENAGFFPGLIAELRLWDIARTSNELVDDMNKRLVGDEKGLIGYWLFEEGEGDISADLTGNGYTANLYQETVWTENSPYNWFSITPTAGTIEFSNESLVSFNLDASGLQIGDYNTEIVVNTNDPYNQEIPVKINFSVDEPLGLPYTDQLQIVAYPNPFAEEMTIEYELKNESSVNISIFDESGRHVSTLVSEFQTAGQHRVTWHNSQAIGSLSHGMYHVLIQMGDGKTQSKRIVYSTQ
ncbi:choice-of-anchor D domain-containing protein [Marinoscillum sp. 108]|uniref:Ig-like domain-containing protein n=1 Tax=Marinoscillum sp. 108 TaxID=2653151 RepID=UPI0012F10B51|nr:choice-of-anchor D domain-containing protein [Marinoscillum sp. 108]VXD11825.1 exported hypothetical protein [Marinoscillum sp. 108]